MADRTVLYKLQMEGNLVPKSKELATNLKLVEKNATSTTNATGSLRKVLAGLAGEVGGAGARIVNMTEGLTGLGGRLGKVGMVLGATAVGVGVVATGLAKATTATIEFGKEAIESEKRIRDLGLVTAEQAATVRALGTAYKEAQQGIDAWNVSFAASRADDIRKANDNWAVWKKTITEVAVGLGVVLSKIALLGQQAPHYGVPEGISRLTPGEEAAKGVPAGISALTDKENAWLSGAPGRAKDAETAAFTETQRQMAEALADFDADNKVIADRIAESNQILGGIIVDKLTAIQQRTPGPTGADRAVGALNVVGGGLPSMIGGALGGPIGMLASAVIDLGPNLAEAIDGGITKIFDLVTGLPGWINEAMFQTVESLERMLPQIIEGIIMMAPRLVMVLIRALPQLTIRIIEAILNIPEQIVQAILDLPEQIWNAIKSAIGGVGVKKGNEGEIASRAILGVLTGGLSEVAIRAGHRGKDGDVFQSFDTGGGGKVERTGFVKVHEGEHMQVAKVNTSGGGRGGDIHIHGSLIDTQGLIEALRKAQGAYGRRNSLAPLPV